MKKRKRTFLLIETLVAITLIALFGLTIIIPSHKVMQERILFLDSMYLHQISKNRLLALKMDILEKKIHLPFTDSKPLLGEMESVECILHKGGTRIYQCVYEIQRTKISKRVAKNKAYLFDLTITFFHRNGKKIPFTLPLYVEVV